MTWQRFCLTLALISMCIFQAYSMGYNKAKFNAWDNELRFKQEATDKLCEEIRKRRDLEDKLEALEKPKEVFICRCDYCGCTNHLTDVGKAVIAEDKEAGRKSRPPKVCSCAKELCDKNGCECKNWIKP